MQIIYRILQIISEIAAYALRTGAIALTVLEVLYTSVLAMVAFWIAAQGSPARGVIAAIVVFIIGTVAAFVLAIQAALWLAAGRAVRRAGIGRMVLEDLFNRLEPSDASPMTGRAPAAQTAYRIGALQHALENAAARMLNEEPAMGAAGALLWLARKIQRLVVRVTVRLIVRDCRTATGEVDLAALRLRMIDLIDGMIERWLKQHLMRMALMILSAVAAASLLIAWAILHLPI